MVIFELDEDTVLTSAERKQLDAAKKLPIVYDEDSPELSPAMFKAFRCIVTQRNRKKKNA